MRRFWKAAGALAVAACTMFAGAATANADENYYTGDIGNTTVSSPTVSEIGSHTANVSFKYSIDPSIMPKVASVCFAVEVMRVTSIKPINDPQLGFFLDDSLVNCQGGTDGGNLTAGLYQSIFGAKTWMEKLGDEVQSEVTGRHFMSYDADHWNHTASGTAQVPVIGLQANATYGNTDSGRDHGFDQDYLAPDTALLMRTQDVCKLADPTGASLACSNAYDQPVDARSLYAGMRIVLKDGSVINYARTAKTVADFTTKAEPTATSAELLPSETETKLSVAGGKVQPGQTARVYVDNLKADAKAKADANSLFWNAYIYSEPRALTSPDGAPFVRVQKEQSTGKYYFDAVIPSDLPAGDHRISVQDDNGAVQALTAVTVGDAPAQTVDKSKLAAAIESAGKLAEKDYTSASWTAFSKALADAKAVAGKQDASQAEVDAAAKGLTDAQAALKKADASNAKPSKPNNGNNGSTKPSGDNKTAADGKKAGLALTGASVAAVAGVLVLLAVLGAGLKVVRSRR